MKKKVEFVKNHSKLLTFQGITPLWVIELVKLALIKLNFIFEKRRYKLDAGLPNFSQIIRWERENTKNDYPGYYFDKERRPENGLMHPNRSTLVLLPSKSTFDVEEYSFYHIFLMVPPFPLRFRP